MHKIPLIELKDIKFQYRRGTEPLFEGLNLSISENEFVGIVGETGVGKTSLLYLINGVIPQFYTAKVLDGEILYKGKPLGENALGTISQEVGLVLDDPEAQLFNLYVKDELAWGPENLGLTQDEIERRRQEATERFQLQDLYNRTTYGLSGGEKQKIAIASVSTLYPKVMMLDEPTSGLDPSGTELVFDAVRTMAKKLDMTILMVEHKIEELADYCDRMILLKGGKIALDLPPDQFFEEADTLGQSGILPPQVTRLGQNLRKKGFNIHPPLNLSQAVPLFTNLLGPNDRNWKSDNLTDKRNDIDPLVTINDLVFGYNKHVKALDGITLSLNQNEFACIIGQNGSGKTTLSKCIKRIVKPPKETIFVNGKDIRDFSSRELAQTIGYVFQNPDHQLFKDDVASEIEFGLKNLKMPKAERKDRVKDTLERFNLWDLRKVHPFRLSRGERQFVALASVYAMEPTLLIADEPTTGLDRISADKLMRELQAINKEKGVSVVVITHWIQLAAEYGERLIALHQGKVLLDGDPRSTFSQAKELAKTNVRPPQITQLCDNLRINPLPLTLKEAEKAIISILNQ
ncbi:MAG: ABC transporter ATP-binding protein [Candidatus Heimdallarchaeota archaeon]|nr:ABC transporter ATP-binding protein [Candidatus Heimdallarchaeota archaeon]